MTPVHGSADQPLVSIALPAFNAAETIGLAVASIRAQAYPHWELLVLDDGSTDTTAGIVSGIGDDRIRLLSDGQNRGLSARLNQAIDLARGTFLARMDADDVAYPERLDKQVRFLLANPEVDLVATRAIAFHGAGKVRGGLPFRETHEEICRRPWATFPMPHPTWMGRIDWFKLHRYRIPEVKRAEDHDLLLRAYGCSRFACLPEVLLGYRQNSFALNRQLKARMYLLAAQWRNHMHAGHPGYALLGSSYQVIKAVADMMASAPGLSALYFKRIDPILLDAERQRWSEVWRGLGAPAGQGHLSSKDGKLRTPGP